MAALAFGSPGELARLRATAWKRDPGHFAEYASSVALPNISAGASRWRQYRHSRYLAAKFRQAATTPGSRQIWCLPPRHGKSLTGSTWGTAWYLDLWPDRRVILTSYAAELANLFGRDVRNMIGSYNATIDPATEQPLMRVDLRPDSKAAHRWNTPQGGGMLTAGVGGQITGFGANLFLVDDPFSNWQEAQSATTRQNVWDWFQSTVMTRLEPGASVIIIMTRWHEDDLVGRLLEQDKTGDGEGWELVRLPAIAEAPPGEDPETWVDEIGRHVGEALCPERYDVDALAKIKASRGSYVWSGMYQQRPAPDEGAILKREWWQRWNVLPPRDRLAGQWLISWDMAFKKSSDSDYVVGQVWARWRADKFLVDEVRDRMTFVDTKRAVRDLHAKWPEVGTILVEDKANGPAIISELARTVPGLVAWNPDQYGSKEARVHAVAGEVEAGNIWLPSDAPFVSDFVEEAAVFPNGAHDDQIDAFTQAILRYREIGDYTPDADSTDTYRDDRTPVR